MKTLRTYGLNSKYGVPQALQEVHVMEDGSEIFYSYGTKIATIDAQGVLWLTSAWNYSQTTNYYRIQFTGKNTAETRKGIADGSIRTEF